MTQAERELWAEGQAMAREFNRYKTEQETILRPSEQTIAKLARILDLPKTYIRSRLSAYAYDAYR